MSEPKHWDDVELQIAGALNTGKARVPDLEGNLHPLFERRRWNCDDFEYATLKPSMHLATNLITTGLQYVANFLSIKKEGAKKDVNKAPLIEEIHLQEVDAEHIYEAAETLEDLAKYVTWETDYDMYDTMNAWGLNVLTNQSKPWRQETWEEIMEHDKLAKTRYRCVTIGIAGQYVDFIHEARHDGEERIRATWHAAITMVHEVGHFIWNYDRQNLPATWTSHFMGPYSEPYIDDMCSSELGNAFVSFIFGGHTPTTIATDKRDNPFKRPLIWKKERTLGDVEKVGGRLPYTPHWSMRTDYLEKQLQQSFWARMGDQKDVLFHQKARSRLEPVTLSGLPKPAFAYIRDWELVNGVPVWKAECGDRAPRPKSVLRELTDAEIELARLESQWEEEDKIENIAKQGLASTKLNPRYLKNRTKINDGTIIPDRVIEKKKEEPDLFAVEKNPEIPPRNPRTIEIRFYSLPDNHPSGDTTKSNIYNSYERWKYGSKIPAEERDQLYKFWEFATETAIVNRFTRVQAAEYCKMHGLGVTYEAAMAAVLTMPESKFARDKKLSLDHLWDAAIVARIGYHIRMEFVDKFYIASSKFEKLEGDAPYVAVEFYSGLIKTVKSKLLSLEHIRNSYDTLEEDEKKYESFLADEAQHKVEVIQQALKDKQFLLRARLERQKSTDPALGEAMVKNYTNQIHKILHTLDPIFTETPWQEDDWEVFFSQNKLPDWGNEEAKVARYYAYEYERKYGHPRYRPLLVDLEDRLRAPGQEMYSFNVDIDQTSVGAIKSALYAKGHFPANCNLVLKIFNGGPVPLQDDDLVAVALWDGGGNAGRPYRDSWIKDILVCEVDEPVPKYLAKEVAERKKGPKLWNQPQTIHRLASMKRKELLIHAQTGLPKPIPALDVNLTVEARIKHIQESAILLDQAMQPDNGNQAVKTDEPIGASILLEQLEDYEDLLEKRLRGGGPTRGEILDLLAEEEDRKKRKSHMGEYVNAIKKRNFGRAQGKTDWELEFIAPFKSGAPAIPTYQEHDDKVGSAAQVRVDEYGNGFGSFLARMGEQIQRPDVVNIPVFSTDRRWSQAL